MCQTTLRRKMVLALWVIVCTLNCIITTSSAFKTIHKHKHNHGPGNNHTIDFVNNFGNIFKDNEKYIYTRPALASVNRSSTGTTFYDNASISISDLQRIIHNDNYSSNKVDASSRQKIKVSNKVTRAAEETLLDCYFREELEASEQQVCQALSKAWPDNSHRFSLLSMPSRYKKLLKIDSRTGNVRATSSLDRESICAPAEQDCFIMVKHFSNTFVRPYSVLK